jgi:hypothetical protein
MTGRISSGDDWARIKKVVEALSELDRKAVYARYSARQYQIGAERFYNHEIMQQALADVLSFRSAALALEQAADDYEETMRGEAILKELT